MKGLLKRFLIIGAVVCSALCFCFAGAACEFDNSQSNGGSEHTEHVDKDGDGKCDVCGNDVQKDPSGGEQGGNSGNDNNKVTYTVRLQRSSGDPLAKVTFIVLDEAGQSVGYATTDSYGEAKFSAAPGNYRLDIADLPEGFQKDVPCELTPGSLEYTFKFPASLITDKELPAGQTLGIGDVMYDFSFTDAKGEKSSLKKLLQDKSAVLLNFFYTTCNPCRMEFPDLIKTYTAYQDKVAVVALDPLDGPDGSTGVLSFVEEMGIPFHVVANNEPSVITFATAFGIDQYPTSLLIDREGVVCFGAAGMGTEHDFTYIFEKYTAEPYEQDIMFPGEEIAPDKPDVQAPASEELSAALDDTGSGFHADYYFVPAGEEAQHEFNWPWVIGEEDGETCVYPSNAGHHNSYSMLYMDVTAAAGKAITFDYKVSCEEVYDDFNVFVDGVVVLTQSGIDARWRTCYAYIPLIEGRYQIVLVFRKDASGTQGDDRVYVKNMRFVDESEITDKAQTLYSCASGTRGSDGKYPTYAPVVLNETDGYYHVATEDGPLVLADLMDATRWSNTSAWEKIMNGGFTYDIDDDGRLDDLTDRMTLFCQYANNSERPGFLGVTAEIKQYLDALVGKYSAGFHENKWLELCSYVKNYGADKDEQIPDPARGLGNYNAFLAVENANGDESAPSDVNHVNVNRMLVPRGIWYKFQPQTTAIYRIMSLGDYDTYGWLREGDTFLTESDDLDFRPDDIASSNGNFSMTVLLEEGKTYYVGCAFHDLNFTGEYDFIITNVGTEGYFWMNASAGEYTFDVTYDDLGNEIYGDFLLKGAVDYRLGDDNIYHVVEPDGTLGKPVYVNLDSTTTSMFPDLMISQMVNVPFYFCENCYYATSLAGTCSICGGAQIKKLNAFELPTPIREDDGKVRCRSFFLGDGEEVLIPDYEKDENGNVIFRDYGTALKGYIDKAKTDYPIDDDGTEHKGFVAAHKDLVDILQNFIIFGDFALTPNIDNAWLLLSCYYLHLKTE